MTSKERLIRLERKIIELEQKIKTLELDIEPSGRISEGFDRLLVI